MKTLTRDEFETFLAFESADSRERFFALIAQSAVKFDVARSLIACTEGDSVAAVLSRCVSYEERIEVLRILSEIHGIEIRKDTLPRCGNQSHAFRSDLANPELLPSNTSTKGTVTVGVATVSRFCVNEIVENVDTGLRYKIAAAHALAVPATHLSNYGRTGFLVNYTYDVEPEAGGEAIRMNEEHLTAAAIASVRE